jgi:hypothetical protein
MLLRRQLVGINLIGALSLRWLGKASELWLDAILYLSLLLAVIFLAIGVVSVFLYVQIRKRGFMLIGVGFLLSAIVDFIVRITRVLWSIYQMEMTFELSILFQLVDSVFLVVSMIVVLIGVIFLRSEFKQKPTP